MDRKFFKSAEWLRQKYEDEHLSAQDIANLVGMSASRIYPIMAKFGIKRRTVAESCREPRRREKTSSHFKGRHLDRNGYVVIRSKSPHYSRNRSMEHRVVMEAIVGRRLNRTEVSHHINGNPSDNRRENLDLMTLSQHSSFHAALRRMGQRAADV